MAKLKVKEASNRDKKYIVFLRKLEMCTVASFSSFEAESKQFQQCGTVVRAPQHCDARRHTAEIVCFRLQIS